MDAAEIRTDRDHRRQAIAGILDRSETRLTINEVAARCGASTANTSMALAALERESRAELHGRRWSSSRPSR